MIRLIFACLISMIWIVSAGADELISDPGLRAAVQTAINAQGFNCPTIVKVTRQSNEDAYGRLFLVICNGVKYRHEYRISVNPAGIATIRPREQGW
jgi:hypothetical protein